MNSYPISGPCSNSVGGDVYVTLGKNSPQEVTVSSACTQNQWSVSLDLTPFYTLHIPYEVKHKNAQDVVQESFTDRFKIKPILEMGRVLWSYQPAKATWENYASSLMCHTIKGGIADEKKHIFLRKISVLNSDDSETGIFFFNYERDIDDDGTIDDGDDNFISKDSFHTNLKRKNVGVQIQKVIESRIGANISGFDFSSDSEDIFHGIFTAPMGSGADWNGRKVNVIGKSVSSITKQKSCAKSHALSIGLSGWESHPLLTFSGGVDAYNIAKLKIRHCLKQGRDDDRTITIDGVNINLGPKEKSPEEIAQRISEKDFSTGTIYDQHPYDVSSKGNEVIFTLQTNTQDPPEITISDFQYERDNQCD